MRRLTGERGVALVFAIVALAALSGGVTTVIYIATQSGHQANLWNAEELAYHYAESGLNEALAVVTNTSNVASDANILPATAGCATTSTHAASTITFPHGSATYTGCYTSSGNEDIWVLTSVGSAVNPNSTGAYVTRTAKATIDIHVPPQTAPMTYQNAWSYVISRGTGDATNCDQSIGVNSLLFPFWVDGNLCMKYSSSTNYGVFAGSSSGTSSLQVKGHVSLDTGATGALPSMGTSGNGVSSLKIASGCRIVANGAYTAAGAYTSPCTTSQRAYVRSGSVGTNPGSLAEPTANYDYYYANGAPGPKHPCVAIGTQGAAGVKSWYTAGGSLPSFESSTGTSADTTRDNSAGAWNLTPTTFDYDCYSNRNGELKWVRNSPAGTAGGVLTVKGSIFIDGDAYISNGQSNTLTIGNYGTLYLSGTFMMSGGSKLCIFSASGNQCGHLFGQPAWDFLANIVIIVADGNGSNRVTPAVPAGDSIYLASNNGTTPIAYQGFLYGTNTIEVDKSIWFQGPMIADEEKFNGPFTMNAWSSPSTGPSGSPGETPQGTYASQATNFSG